MTAAHPVTVHTVDGSRVGDLPCSVLGNQLWSRERNEVSRCEFNIATQAVPELVAELRPWLHWVTAWDGGVPVWTGPIHRVVMDDRITAVSARDVSTFMWRTRVPTTRTWETTDPGRIAANLWELMLEIHGVNAHPQVYPDPAAEKFDFQTVADSRMMHQAIDDLTKLGLDWAVVGGTPVFGPPVDGPVETLRECDFQTELRVVRDGVDTFNNVRVQGKNYAETHIEPLAGLNLQSLVSLDDLFGVANIQRATRQYTKNAARIRDVLEVPASASLHPDAPVSLADLVPGTQFLVQARGLSTVMVLDKAEVVSEAGTYDIRVSLESRSVATELGTATGQVGML